MWPMRGADNPKAYIILVLHAHLPYVRIPGKKIPLQELWLFQAITECYIPLIKCFRELIKENVNFHITLSVSPTLISMLGDNYYKDKYRHYLGVLLNIINIILNDNNDDVKPAVLELGKKIKETSGYFDSTGGDIINEFKKLAKDGRINLITCPAAHPVLPLYRFNDDFVKNQIATGLRIFRKAFGTSPEGFWLPEMGYFSGLDRMLTAENIKYTFLDAHSVYLTDYAPSYGNFFPSVTDNGLAVFPREMKLSNTIWSAERGYPGDPRYREFHFDYTFSLPDPLIESMEIERIPLGLKIYRITGKGTHKDFYNRAGAMDAAGEHAEDFFNRIIRRADEIGNSIGRTPVFTLPFDAELFGHWWHEGPTFLKHIIKKISASDCVKLVSPREMISEAGLDTVSPAESSWGEGGFFSVWTHPECMWLYPRVADLYNRIINLAAQKKHRQAALQALKEIMLASSSDWIFFIANNTSREYGTMRLKDHVKAAEKILESAEKNRAGEKFLSERKSLYPIFDDIKM